MTDIEKAFRNGTLDVFDRGSSQKPTHYLVDAETGEVTRNLYEGTQIRTFIQTQSAIRCKHVTEAQISYGTFTFLFFTPLQDLGFDISPSNYTRLMHASTFLTYDGYLGEIVVGGIRPFNRSRIKDKMKLSSREFDYFWSEMVAAGLFRLGTVRDIITNRDVKAIFLDETRFRKGAIDTSVDRSFIRLNAEGVQSLYETCTSARAHKTLAYIFKIIPWINREWNIACKNPEERDYDAIRYLRLGEFADMVGYSRDNAKRLAKDLNSVRFEWHGREQAAFIYMTNAPDRPEEWIIAVNPRVYYAGQNFELLRIPDCGRR